MECVVKPLRDVKVTGSKPPETKKSNHVKGGAGGTIPECLDAPELRFLKPQVNLVPNVFNNTLLHYYNV